MKKRDPNKFYHRVLSAKNINGNQLIKLYGMKFGFLRILKPDRTKSTAVNKDIKKMAYAYWLCICELCGCKVSIRSDVLRNGLSRMCSQCCYDARERFREAVREEVRQKFLERLEEEERLKNLSKQKRKRRKINKLAPGTMVKPTLYAAFSGAKALAKIKGLRASGMRISEIAEMLEITQQEVMNELRKSN